MTERRLYIGILLSWILGALTISGVFGLEKFKRHYGWMFIGGTAFILEAIILVHLYRQIFLIYRRGYQNIQN